MANPVDSTNPETMNELTDSEREQLMVVMRRAKEFEIEEEKNLLRQPLEGQLLKFTNVMKGYQYRWFVLNPEMGQLEYYEKEDHKKSMKPRGALHLLGATVSPSEEDSQTFFVYANNGEFFRLKAFDARERQYWVNRLRAVAEFHSENVTNPATTHLEISHTSGSSSSLHHVGGPTPGPSGANPHGNPARAESHFGERVRNQNVLASTPDNLSLKKQKRIAVKGIGESGISTSSGFDPLRDAKDLIGELRRETDSFEDEIRALSNSSDINRLDKNLLLAKATSKATLSCLEECLRILRDQQSSVYQYPYSHCSDGILSAMNGGCSTRPASAGATTAASAAPASLATSVSGGTPFGSQQLATEVKPFADSCSPAGDDKTITEGLPLPIAGMATEAIPVNHDEDEADEDTPTNEHDSAGSLVEEHKSVILHLLSQLKLGMDLTKVVLPTFILEKRSLLEMFADCMAHPDMFLRITDCRDIESRMLAVMEWYLTSFHAGRKGSLAKKPYNPIIGETFHCSWQVPVYDDRGDIITLYYTAEQVSHHPPISAFHFECPQRKMALDASIYTKSKFNGMSICAVMVGKLCLKLGEHDDEEYVFTLPTAYARSILSVPWVELGDKVTLSCQKTKYAASIMFHTKPFYGGKLHQISGEVRNPAGVCVCKLAGEWNGVLEFEYPSRGISDKKALDVNLLPITNKRVRPLALQHPHESRRLWQHVTKSLKQGNLQLATESKKQLEEQQRVSERYRKEHNIAFPVKYFHRFGDNWIYHRLSKPASNPNEGAQATVPSTSSSSPANANMSSATEHSVAESSGHSSATVS